MAVERTETESLDTSMTITRPSDREIVVTRTFDAPRRLVFEAWTTPEYMKRWHGPCYLTMTLCEIDLRPGGKYRYVLSAPDGSEYAFSGEYREIIVPELLVYTWSFEVYPDKAALETLIFEEQDGRTTLTMKTLFETAEDFAGWAASGAESGMKETLDRLAEFLRETSRA